MFKGPQKTIQSSIHIQGKGLHSGIKGNLYLKTADVNTGISLVECLREIDERAAKHEKC